MKYLQILIAVLIIGCTNKKVENNSETVNLSDSKNSKNQNKYDFKSDSIGFNSPEEVAKQVIDFLQKGDVDKYLKTAITLEAQKYLFSENFEYRPDIKDHEEYMSLLEAKFKRRLNNFLIRAEYIKEIMEDDKAFKIEKATIDTITIEDVRIKNYGGFNRFIVGKWADITVKMNFNNEDYFFEIPQIVKLKDKWFLYYPEYYIRTKKDLDFIEKRVKEINEKADEFWL
jgi:hypothetical protein